MAVYRRHQVGSADSLSWQEQYLYGSSRLGQVKTDVLLSGIPDTISIYNHLSELKTGNKRYELTNHLGNILAVITDRKIPKTYNVNSTFADYYDPVVLSATDYYPFGMEMPGRTMASGGYRYGFNGKEKDTEGEWGTQTHYDYGARIYNLSIGRWLSVDPRAGKYPSWSPYNYTKGNPIVNIDPQGDTTRIYTTAGELLGTIKDHFSNEEHFFDSDSEMLPALNSPINSLEQARAVATFMRSQSKAYIGENTRQQMADISALADSEGGNELAFVLGFNGKSKELTVKQVRTVYSEINSTSIPYSTLNDYTTDEFTILGSGHTHTKAGFRNLFGNRKFNLSDFNKPSYDPTGRSTGDYTNSLFGDMHKSNVQFIASPLGYTIHSLYEDAPQGSDADYQIKNKGDVFDYLGNFSIHYNFE